VNSPFGPLAQGTHIGVLDGGSLRIEQSIYAVLFFNGVQLNTASNP
jgi:hypothetical protein